MIIQWLAPFFTVIPGVGDNNAVLLTGVNEIPDEYAGHWQVQEYIGRGLLQVIEAAGTVMDGKKKLPAVEAFGWPKELALPIQERDEGSVLRIISDCFNDKTLDSLAKRDPRPAIQAAIAAQRGKQGVEFPSAAVQGSPMPPAASNPSLDQVRAQAQALTGAIG